MAAEVAILMGSFDGARFLAAQLASIAAQTHAAWHLHVSDDGSRDATRAILAALRMARPWESRPASYDGRASAHSGSPLS